MRHLEQFTLSSLCMGFSLNIPVIGCFWFSIIFFIYGMIAGSNNSRHNIKTLIFHIVCIYCYLFDCVSLVFLYLLPGPVQQEQTSILCFVQTKSVLSSDYAVWCSFDSLKCDFLPNLEKIQQIRIIFFIHGHHLPFGNSHHPWRIWSALHHRVLSLHP